MAETPEIIPLHMVVAELLLRQWANGVSGHYGVPVFLCGSALNPDNSNPRDWDVRLRLENEDFSLRYARSHYANAVNRWEAEGVTGEWSAMRWSWSDDCVRQTKRGQRATGLNIDFQIYPAIHWDRKYAKMPRLRLDTRHWDESDWAAYHQRIKNG